MGIRSDWGVTRTLSSKKIKTPSGYILVADSVYGNSVSGREGTQAANFTWWNVPSQAYAGIYLRHNNQVNCLFADGHVASMNESELKLLDSWSAAVGIPWTGYRKDMSIF